MVDSRTTNDSVRRRRECATCKRRFTTYERMGHPEIKVAKRSGKAVDFDHDKLVRVLARVGRGRPAVEPVRLARAIEADLVDEGVKSVRSGELAARVLRRLRELDAVAYNRMAANYIGEDGQLRTEPRAANDQPESQLPLPGTEPE